ncbi:uncharacterized protein LOC115034990 isoform X2 [Acyrthosiphon pisum]|nr:uncharacterized protein LOC115034990 isoform X2 [Acyrthosiphon pisum]
MVKRCVICGNVDGDVSVHRFPTDVHRPQWVEFVVNQGFPVNLRSMLCSRHFVPGLDYEERDVRRRLVRTAVPSLVSIYISYHTYITKHHNSLISNPTITLHYNRHDLPT